MGDGGQTIHHLAIDLGASGGTVVRGEVAPDALALEELHRFDNRPVERDGRYVWPIERLRDEIGAGIRRADGGTLDSVGIDTWGLDFGLLADGDLLRAPVSYRDPALLSTADAVFERANRREIFEATGIANWNTPNTLFQYHHLATEEPALLARADRLLMMPQLLTHLLGGRPAGEATIASTTQLLDVREGAWATALLDRLDLPVGPLPDLEPPGTRVGRLDPGIVEGLSSDPDLVLPASHDTASAVAGLPLSGERAFLSTGTWFLLGVELDEPRIDDAAFAVGASNELGAGGTVRFLRNLAGFFVLEECRESWRSDGRDADYDALLAAAREADPFGPLIDADDPRFDIEGDAVAAVEDYCRETGQPVPRDRGALVRCLLESLAAKTALVLDRLLDAAGETSDRLHVGGGGVRNELFCSMLASAVDRPVVAGPAEATATGNLLTQAVAAGEINDLGAGRRLVAEHADITRYEPDGEPRWADATARMAELVERGGE